MCAAGSVLASSEPENGYSGSLSTESGGIVGTQSWKKGSEFNWNVTYNTKTGLWKYSYSLEVASKAISHLIIEVPASFTAGDILGVNNEGGLDPSHFEVSTFVVGGNGNSNPDLPGVVEGVKFLTSGSPLHLAFSFTTNRSPTLGSYYAKDGKDGGSFAYQSNAGFAKHISPSSAENSYNFIMVPGDGFGAYVSIPELNTCVFGLFGVTMLLTYRRKRY